MGASYSFKMSSAVFTGADPLPLLLRLCCCCPVALPVDAAGPSAAAAGAFVLTAMVWILLIRS
jgi:hypothetical protein